MKEFDAALEKEATKLKKELPVIPVHRTIDGALNGYSVIKSIFDVRYCTEPQSNSLDAMHEWMTTPLGSIGALGVCGFFTALACTAGIQENQSKETIIGESWKTTREGLQAGRNGFKAVRTAIFTASAFTTQNLKYLILPTSLAMSGLYMVNRLYMLRVNKQKKETIKKNQDAFDSIMSYGFFRLKGVSMKNGTHFIETPSSPEGSKQSPKEKPIKNSFIIHKNSENQEKLYYTDHKGKATEIKNASVSKIKTIIQQTGSSHLSLLQLNELLPQKVALKYFAELKKQKLEEVKKQKLKMDFEARSRLHYVIRGFNGLIDGLYLYLGIVLGIASFNPPALAFLTFLSCIYCILCVCSRLFEEYQSQQELLVTQYRMDLAIISKELEIDLIKLNKLTHAIALEQNSEKAKILEDLRAKWDEKLQKDLTDFEKKRTFLKKRGYLSAVETTLTGIKHSLPFYGALLSFVFALAFIGFITGFALPAPFIFAIVMMGIPIITAGIWHAFRNRLTPPPELIAEEKIRLSELSDIIHRVKSSFKLIHEDQKQAHQALLESNQIKQKLLDWILIGLQVDPLADTYYADWAEFWRSFWAGLSKGRKAIEMLLNRFQEPDASGHYQDTPLMCNIMIPVAFVYAVIYALNAFIKGFTRKNKSNDNFFKSQPPNPTALEKNTSAPNNPKNENAAGKSGQQKKTSPKNESTKQLKSELKEPSSSLFRFFGVGKIPVTETPSPALTPSESRAVLSEGFV